ncbi:MAG: FAD-binding oxidoreductase [Phenylobacterium sp.]|nr:FAD-binding oxidoreductase [Phenylobacterium sp.]
MRQANFIIIGGGIAGASAAYELSASASVILLERESRPGYHSTGRSAALFSETYGPPIVCALSCASRAFLEEPPAGLCEYPLLSPSGSLHLGSEADREALEALVAHARGLGVEAYEMDEAAIRRLVPAMRPEHARLGVLEPGAKNIDVDALHQGWLRGARRRGAEVRTDAEVVGLERRGDLWRVRLSDEVLECAAIINAAGAWADDVAEMAGLARLGVAPLRRTAAVVKAPQDVDISGWPLVIAADESFYFKPDAGLLLVSPADETPTPPCDAWADDFDVAVALDRIMTATTLQIDRVVRSWAGLRSFAPDRKPVVGPDPEAETFLWLAGQGGYGIQTSPAVSRLIASLALRGDWQGFDPGELSPARFLARTA